MTDELKAAIREEVTRQLDEREAEAKKDLETAQELLAQLRTAELHRIPHFQVPRVGPSSLIIDHDPKDAATHGKPHFIE